jgi:hypothetical protein
MIAPSHERVHSLEDDNGQDLDLLARKAARWSRDNLEALKAAKPDMAGLMNREADNWKALFAIADAAGAKWGRRAREAARAAADQREDQSIRVQVLSGIKTIFNKSPDQTEWPSALLVERLVGIEGAPWAEFGKAQRPITQNALARLLKPIGIRPTPVTAARVGGYQRWQFDDAFERYLTPTPIFGVCNLSSSHNAVDTAQVGDFKPLIEKPNERFETREEPNRDGHYERLRDLKPEKSGSQTKEASEPIPPTAPAAAPPPLCDHCGGDQGIVNGWDWPGRPAGIWLHSQCEEGWHDQETGRAPPAMRGGR